MLVVVLLALALLLKLYTRHNEVHQVPDFTNMTMFEAKNTARKSDVRLDIVDSIYVKRMQRGAIVRQEPKPGTLVKKGRRVMVTINAKTPKQIPMPNLVGYSLRSAQAELISRGLEVGHLNYVNDIATNNVMRQLYRGSEIQPGAMVASESAIDLVLGLNYKENTTTVPNVIGRKYRKAVEMIHENSLNTGRLIFDNNVRSFQDSLNAVVYNQRPAFDNESILMGRSVTLYLTLDETKVPAPANK